MKQWHRNVWKTQSASLWNYIRNISAHFPSSSIFTILTDSLKTKLLAYCTCKYQLASLNSTCLITCARCLIIGLGSPGKKYTLGSKKNNLNVNVMLILKDTSEQSYIKIPKYMIYHTNYSKHKAT